MTVRDDLRTFLRRPLEFAHDVSEESQRDWLAGLAFAREAIIGNQSEFSLREAQQRGWEGIAKHRTSLILGPPGTGKTFALSWMALGYLEGRRAAGRPCRVYVTGFTRNSIANLLEAVRKRAIHARGPIRMIWLGHEPDQSLPDGVEVIKPEDLREALNSEYVVIGATGWGLFRAIERGRLAEAQGPTAPLFDLVCIDEASQMVISQGLLSIAGLAPQGRVLVAGDDKQLAPVRETHEREIDGLRLGSSLYGFLKHAGIEVFPLTETFRLNQLLSEYPAQVFYEGRYESVAEVKSKRLALHESWELGLQDWERHALDPDNPVCILLYSGPLCGTSNEFEARIAAGLVARLRARMVPPDREDELSSQTFWNQRLAVVSPHRAQNALLRTLIRATGFGEDCVVETVDRIQGRERDAIVACYTVSDPEFAKMEASFIFSPERFNVTITRARTKLILVVARQLLSVVPEDDELFEQAQVLRNFVYETQEVATWSVMGPAGASVPLTVRVRRFDDAANLEVDATQVPSEPPPDEGALDPVLTELLDAIRRLAKTSKHKSAASFALTKALSRTQQEIHEGLLKLFELGMVVIRLKDGPYGPFWTAKPRDPAQRPLPCDLESVRNHIQGLLGALRHGRYAPFYFIVRDHFCWLDLDGEDRLEPLVDALVVEGVLEWGANDKGRRTLDLTVARQQEAKPVERLPLPEVPSESDFEVLNSLENLEQGRINFGVYEAWVHPAELASITHRSATELAPVLRRLRQDGWLMSLDDGRMRSRAAELARELRYIKQRFREDDAGNRPFLVRATKVRFVDRSKPTRNQPLSRTLTTLEELLGSDPTTVRVLRGAGQMLSERWMVDDPLLTGFQSRALLEVLPAWFGRSETRSFVITADTGSGKTEAAALPLIIASAIDALEGVTGTRCVLVYPRIRLANNQAQRLAGYLAALARQDGMPTLTLGVQNSEVPSNFDGELGAHWKRVGSRYAFPLFPCPEGECGGDLLLTPTPDTHQPDHLHCRRCGWSFAGWVGSKRSLGKVDTSIFITTTESLHSWLHSQWRGRLFGDARGVLPPRAVLADEIHIYSHIQGAQVGYALRRLLARLRINSRDPQDRPLAVGMSATLGEPGRVWEELCGCGPVTQISPTPEEREPNPRSREYFYFVQPEIESRGKDVAGASTTIQSLMCLAHGMRRRRGNRGGYRALAFLDSIDKVKRLHGDYIDAERNNRLARLRTSRYGTVPPESTPRRECCGHPETCSRFVDGECWFFAARDPHQETANGAYEAGQSLSVCQSPVFSGTKERVDDMIGSSDVVFATSSLEVGFDDPEMSLVFQHYAPLNAASFVQRKGRGGRGADDRPVTGVTLSVYSPRDTWFFRRPERMLEAASFRVPLNMRNFFVRRGQLIATLLDAAARNHHYRQDPSPNLPAHVFAEAMIMIRDIFGERVFVDMGITDLQALWAQVRPKISNPATTGLACWVAQIPEVPTQLFETINLPAVRVSFIDDNNDPVGKEEDIGVALATCAPGTATRRYGFGVTHWVTPHSGRTPWAAVDHRSQHETFEPIPGGLTALRLALPRYLHQEIGDNVVLAAIRPSELRLEKLGRFDGAGWTPFVGYDRSTTRLVDLTSSAEEHPGINPKSQGSLSGFIICNARRDQGQPRAVGALEPLTTGLYAYQGSGAAEQGTGLTVSRIYWGAESRIIVDVNSFKREEFIHTQTFVEAQQHAAHHKRGAPAPAVQLYGYQVSTEGVRLRLDQDTLDRFVEHEFDRIEGTRDGRWLRGQYFRFLVLSGAPQAGMNRFQARELADLLVTARAFENTNEKLQRLLRRWDVGHFRQLLLETYTQYLSLHPLLTEQRIVRIAEELAKPHLAGMQGFLVQAIAGCKDDQGFRQYLRSLALHGLAMRLQQLFAIHGAGDPRRVLFHTKLPIQFGEDADDVIVVCEDGEHGDGTTRTFLETLDIAFGELRAGALFECPNAREDEVLERLLEDADLANTWSLRDPISADRIGELAGVLGLDPEDDANIMQSVVRVLYDSEDIGGERFSYRSLQQEVRTVREQLSAEMDRDPTAWELVGRVVALARGGDPSVQRWAQLRRCYLELEDAAQEGSLEADARLGDQVYRLSARLCVDGCQACLHTGSPLFPQQMLDATVSRTVLTRLAEFLGWS
ncbi:DNA helicase [Enhygromyxa salina]|uniref:DNA helicase n=1 Tax=Enhygromyxa salina TaxID=215803 RepID=A0A0C2DD06_9BACT|nr:AAA domain-containing protein [Enhygromyxa salina]KIG17587.1 DNA helicase [Enhygromyxa salina]